MKGGKATLVYSKNASNIVILSWAWLEYIEKHTVAKYTVHSIINVNKIDELKVNRLTDYEFMSNQHIVNGSIGKESKVTELTVSQKRLPIIHYHSSHCYVESFEFARD